VQSRVPLVLVYSRSGPYAALARAALDGALAALAEVNNAGFDFRLSPEICDPAGATDRYEIMLDAALRRSGARQVVGGITSWSRKEMLPVIERHRALLWYGCPYEGFEAHDRVVYLGASPNQHIVPLLAHVLSRYGGRAYLVGSNYIWAWETNRIARELIADHGGQVVGERYVPLGSTDIAHIIDEIRRHKPDFVLNNLIGPSSYAFLAASRELANTDPDFAPARRPVISCNLTECELNEIGEAGIGHLSISAYFDSLPTDENQVFLARMQASGVRRPVSAFFVGAYISVRILAEAIRETGTDDPEVILPIVTSRRHQTPLGDLHIDPATNHAALTPHLGRLAAEGRFEIIESAAAPIVADPYLSHRIPTSNRPASHHRAVCALRIVQ
jgi:branched-chain amino acid transport system substrate-binding protein